jgi:hypothetical protein
MNRPELRKLIIKEMDALITDDAIFSDRETPGIRQVHDIPGDYSSDDSLQCDHPDWSPSCSKNNMLDDHSSQSGEGKMARAGLYHIMKDALLLYDMLEDDDDLPEWVESKITTARDRISSAVDYIDYRMNNQIMKR